MSVYYYFICEKGDKVYGVNLGSSISIDDIKDLEEVDATVFELDDLAEEVSECLEKSVKDFDISCLGKVLAIVDRVVKLKYDVSVASYGDLVRTLAVWGLYYLLDCDRYYIMSEYEFDKVFGDRKVIWLSD